MRKKAEGLTKEYLAQNRWVETKDPIYPFEKKIENRNPINTDPDDTELTLVVHRKFNVFAIGLVFPNGGLLNLNIPTIEDLESFERMINFYDCPY